MSRFSPIKAKVAAIADDDYVMAEGSSTADYAHIEKPGLSIPVVQAISGYKHEPDWMRVKRLEALSRFEASPTPTWGGDLQSIDFSAYHYYLKPTSGEVKSWQDVPADIKNTFDRLKIPKAEREVLAGVKTQWDSEVVYGSLKATWENQGVIFTSMDEALIKYPDMVREYFGKLIPAGDNKFAALNTAVWSGGSFVYVPPGVEVSMPLQAYFRINSPRAGQFERTLIIADTGSKVHYTEGCFIAGTKIATKQGLVNIEAIKINDSVWTHQGKLQTVYNIQKRQYSGSLYKLKVVGLPNQIEATQEHPILAVKRVQTNERNISWEKIWIPIKDLEVKDYVCCPIINTNDIQSRRTFKVKKGMGKHGFVDIDMEMAITPDLFRLIGYYVAEGSVSNEHYLSFSFSDKELNYIEDVERLIIQCNLGTKIHKSIHKTNHGISVVLSSAIASRLFILFANHQAAHKKLSDWIMCESIEKQKQLILGWFRGDGNYYKKHNKHGLKEMFRISAVSYDLAFQGWQILARLGIASSINRQKRSHLNKQDIYNLVIAGEAMIKFGEIVGIPIDCEINHKKRATAYYLDNNYIYCPIKTITKRQVDNVDVYNFSVNNDESYSVEGVAVHNCTAPSYSSSSLHSAVVEIFVKPGARVQYTTVQNWYKTVYNLVTKRAYVEAEGEMIWTDFNMGSRLTMKYPGFILAGKGARGETLSMALAGADQHQDTGSKAIHLAPYTTSTIISKSISKNGGRTSYRGLVNIGPNAHHSKSKVVCDALLLDDLSRSDTYPTNQILNNQTTLEHEATVSKIGEDQLFYLMTKGLSEEAAAKLIVNGFVAPLVKQLPLEYALEMNRLIDMEMEGSVG